MRNVKNMFDDEYQGMGPVSLDKLSLVQTQEAEREKQRKLKRYLDNQKRNKKVLEANLDVPQLTDSMVSESSPSMVEQSAENTRPDLKSGMDRYMPYNAPTEPRSEADVPMALPEPSVPYDGVFGERNLKGQRYGLGISNEGSIPYESPSKYQSLGLMGTDSESAKTEDYGLDLPELEKQKISSNQGMGSVGSNRQNSRDMLYDYLTNRRNSEPEFQQQYRNLSNEAETGRVLNTFASGLGEMASMAGTLGGKRADTGDMKALPNAIYGSMRKQADETLGLRRLENQEQVSDIKMLRDLEKGDLDNLRTQKILADLHKQRNVPKTTQFYNEGDPEKGIAPSTMVIDSDGKFKEQALPMGTKSMANAYTLGQPLYTPEGKTIIPQTSRGGGTKYLEAPSGAMPAEGLRIRNQAEADKADARLKEIESERKTASDKEKQKLDREEFALKKAQFQWTKSKDNRQEDRKDEELDVKKSKVTKGAEKQTQFEKKSALQGSVALKALQQIEDLENGGPDGKRKPYRPGTRAIIGNMAGGAGGLIGNRVLSDDDRLYETASNQLVEMLLRNVTGAAAQKDEIRRMMASYKIQGGDDESTIRYKQESRKNFVNGILQSAQKGGASGSPAKVVAEKKYSPSRNKTKITYSDGSTETVEGRQ